MTDFGRAFLEASQQNPHMFAAPGVAFAFFDGITKSVAGYTYARSAHRTYIRTYTHTPEHYYFDH